MNLHTNLDLTYCVGLFKEFIMIHRLDVKMKHEKDILKGEVLLI